MNDESAKLRYALRLRWTGTALAGGLLACGMLAGAWSQTRIQTRIDTAGMAAQHATAATADESGYVGSAQCARCHAGISRDFSQTDMGRSMEPMTPEVIAGLKLPAELYDAKLDRHFTMYAQDGKAFQSEFQTAPDGSEVFRDTHALSWKMGAGENGFGLLVEREHTLFQAPLSYYTQAGKWALSPGYEFGDYGFNRPILTGCASCHSGRPRPIAGTNGRFADPPFSQLPIGCENCHGPGQEHIRRMDARKKGGPMGDAAIVNPSDLSMPLANQICMSCHEVGDVRVYKEGKTYQDFRPGMPLDRIVSIFQVPPRPDSPPLPDHLEHYYSMTLSKCYRASGGRMGCITCHDPHVEPSAEQAPAYFNAKCMSCHTAKSCTRTGDNAMHARAKNDAGNCIGCHMPKRDIKVISHSSATNHRIQARPDESFPEEAFHQTTASLPDLIHLNPDPTAKTDDISAMTLLQAYGELSGNKPEYRAPYLRALATLENSDADHEIVQAALGRRDLLSGNNDGAIAHFQHALQLGPPQAAVYGDLAQAEAKLGNLQQAVQDLRKGIDLDPFNPILQKNLVVQLIALKQYPEALAAIEKYLERFPQDSTMRRALQMARRASVSQP